MRLVALLLALVLVLAGLPVQAEELPLDFDACPSVVVDQHCCCDHPPEESCPCEAKPANPAPTPEPRQATPTTRTIDLAPAPSPLVVSAAPARTYVPAARVLNPPPARRLHALNCVFLE